MRKLLLVSVLGIVGSTGCGAISDWRLESRVRAQCEGNLASRGISQRGMNMEQAVDICVESDLRQIRD